MEQINGSDFPDKKWVANGYDDTEVPTATDRNMLFLMNTINYLIKKVNDLEEGK